VEKFESNLEFALKLDIDDELSEYRDRFHFPKQVDHHPVVYLNGNSLGLQPKSARNYLNQELDDWRDFGIEGHFKSQTPWLNYHELLTEGASMLLGAHSEEVVMMNSLTVNLHLMMISFYKPTKERYKILIEYSPFPSDMYAFESQAKLNGLDPEDAIIEVMPSDGEYVSKNDILEILKQEGDKIALILFGGVNYYTGQVYDMEWLTGVGHRFGCIVGLDLAHAIGNVKLNLHDWNVDFAVFCTYKYLNSGPGSTGGVFVHEMHVKKTDKIRLAGWWGHNKERRFLMEPGFDPIPTAEGWQLSNAPVVALACVLASFEIFLETGMDLLIKKSTALTAYTTYLLKPLKDKITIITPKERGCQLSIVIHQNAKEIHKQLEQKGVYADWREPNVIRIAPVPLYNSFEDCYNFVQLLRDLL